MNAEGKGENTIGKKGLLGVLPLTKGKELFCVCAHHMVQAVKFEPSFRVQVAYDQSWRLGKV